MNGPYYRNHSRSVPVQQPKVVSIPVHFVSSDQPQTNITTLKYSSALKIQKVFKGHTVRKSVKKIVSIRNEVNEIEKRLENDVVFVDLLRKDAKERLRVNETLMSLLFKLDSVRGVENGVREVRKSVAKKAVALQDKLDSIAQTLEQDYDDVSNGEDDVSNGIRSKVNEEEDVEEEAVDDDVSKNDQISESVEDQVIDDVSNKIGDQELNEAMNEDLVKEFDDDVSKNDQNSESVEDRVIDDVSCKSRDHQELVVNEAMNEDSVKECDDDVSSNVQNREPVGNEEGVENKCDEDDVSKSCCDHEMVVNESTMKECGADDDVSKRCCDKGLVEKLMCDNAKMMKLMIQISERNEMQTRMINSLSKRVDQLEKAFMSDKSRRRKKSYTRREKDGFCI